VLNMPGIDPQMIRSQIYYGPVDVQHRIVGGTLSELTHLEALGDGRHRYTGQITIHNSGKHGFAVRVIPGNEDLYTPFIPGLIAWDVEQPAAKPEPVKETVKAAT